MSEVAVRYEIVGSVGIGSSVGADVETNPTLRETVRAEACKVGAEAVLIVVNGSGGFMSTRSTGVWLLHKRASPPAWAALLGAPAAPASK